MLISGFLTITQFMQQKLASYKANWPGFSGPVYYMLELFLTAPKKAWDLWAAPTMSAATRADIQKNFPVLLSRAAKADIIQRQLSGMNYDFGTYFANIFYPALSQKMYSRWANGNINLFLTWVLAHWKANIAKLSKKQRASWRDWLTGKLKASRPDWESKAKPDLVEKVQKTIYAAQYKAAIEKEKAVVQAAAFAEGQTGRVMGFALLGVLALGLFAAFRGRKGAGA